MAQICCTRRKNPHAFGVIWCDRCRGEGMAPRSHKRIEWYEYCGTRERRMSNWGGPIVVSMNRILALTFSMVTLVSIAAGQSGSFDALLEKAKAGDFDAQNEVGISYSEGRGVLSNQRTAVYWFRKSAENGYPIGICNLGLHYGRGWGVRRDPILMMKYVFAANAINGLKCNPGDYVYVFKPSKCAIQRGWTLAVDWLRAHPSFDDNFGNRPWMEENGQYGVTRREHGPSFDVPPRGKVACKKNKRNRKASGSRPEKQLSNITGLAVAGVNFAVQ